jgi:peroxiredoxin
MMIALKAGEVAPDFEVPAVLGDSKTRFRLSNFRGRRHVVLAFYALDWTPT